VWHLRRYMGASLRAAFKRQSIAAPVKPVSPMDVRGERIRWPTSD
jgi:hypothetical protein